MEYEFFQNVYNGSYKSSFSMGHEIISTWLEEELGTSIDKIKSVVQELRAINQDSNWKYPGNDLHLMADYEEVSIASTAVLAQKEQIISDKYSDPDYMLREFSELDYPEYDDSNELSLYNDEQHSVCCRIEFIAMLEQWLDFIAK